MLPASLRLSFGLVVHDDVHGIGSTWRISVLPVLLLVLLLAPPTVIATAQPISPDSVSHAHWTHPEAGMPLVETYTPEDYNADPQNWMAMQGDNGVLHVANTRGVLSFDGARWSLIPVSNRSIVRGLAQGADGHIYVGAQDELGYLAPSDSGQHYVSLRDQIEEGPDDLGNIWSVEAAGSFVYFHTYEGLYRWSTSDKTMHHWTPAEADDYFFPLVTVHGTPYVASQTEGVNAVAGDSLRPVFSLPPTESGDSQSIRDLAPYGDDQILVATSTNALYVYDDNADDDNAVRALSLSFADRFGDALMYDLNRLSDGTYALATIGAGLFLFDASGTLIRHFPFPNQPVLSTYEDHEGGVWATLDSGLRRIDWNTPLSVFSGEYDDETVTDVVRHNDTLTVSTNHGMGTIVPSAEPGAPARLEKHAPFTQIWNLHQDRDTLLVGAASDLFRWEQSDQYEGVGLQESHAFRVTAAPHAPNQLYVSTSRGIERFERSDSTAWTRTGNLRDDIGNFSRPAWANNSTLWVGTRYAGVVRVQVDDEGRPVGTQHFTTTDGLPEGHVMPFRFGDAVLFSTEEGVHRFHPDTEQFNRTQDPPYVPGSLNEPRVLMAADGAGRWWGNTEVGFGWWSQDRSDWTWQMRSLRRVPRAVIRAALAEDAVVWLATDGGLLRYQPNADTLSAGKVLLRDMSAIPSETALHTADSSSEPPPIRYANNSVRIRYAAPSFTMPHTTEYRVRLSGLSETWSQWTTQAQRDFTNLAPGSYTFEVQARTARGTVTDISPYTFTILPPWYRTWWAYLLYVLGGGGLLVGIVQWRTHSLRQQQRHLEQLVDARTSEIRDKNEQLARQARRLQSLDRSKSQFFANISHELRTPLTLILGPVQQLLAQHSADNETTHRLSVVKRNAERLLHMVKQLLGLARLEAGTLAMSPTPCALGQRLAAHARTFIDLGRQHDIAVRVEHSAPPENAPPAYADLEYMQQVVSNLMSNAIKFTPKGGHVMVRIDETETETRLLVSDTGIGIAEAHHQTIFERFQQVDGSPTRAHEGAGIGLALTKDLVEAHGGRITVDSALEEGATFTVILPRGREALPERYRPSSESENADTAFNTDPTPDAALPFVASSGAVSGDTATTGDASIPSSDTAPANSTHRTPGPPTPSRAPLLLIVDDNADMRAYVRSIMEAEFRILEAEHGQAGLEQATTHLPDLILADVMMPGMDGMEMTRRLRDTTETAAIPVIMVTARADASSELQGLSDGAYDYITKPFDPAVLQMRIHGMMKWMQRLRRRMRSSSAQDTSAASASTAAPPKSNGEPAPDASMSAFERKARAIIEANLTESGFDVDDLAEEMAVSRSTIYRRARSNNAPSPAALVREVRMSTAHGLLEAGEGTVTEVAYAVGYESLSSFSDQFRSHFGYPPSTVSASTST